MIKRWIRSLIQRAELSFLHFVKAPCDEEFIAVVHMGHLYLARGSMFYMLGPCQDVINKIFAVPTKPQTKEPKMSSLEVTDQEAAAVAKKPRVSLASMEAKIRGRYDFTGEKIVDEGTPVDTSLKILSICVLVLTNGFTLIGKSAPASPENFDAALGKKFAYEDAVRQMWPLEGYALREKLSEAA